MQTLFRCLLYLYPAAFSREFGDEMMWVFTQSWRDARQQAFRSRALFLSREILGLLSGAIRGRLSGWDSTRRFDMRPFRFPRFVIPLMLVVLFNVFTVMDKASHLARFSISGRVTGTAGGHFGLGAWLLPMVGLFLFVMLVLGAIGYAVLCVLRQSGVERLANIRPWARTK